MLINKIHKHLRQKSLLHAVKRKIISQKNGISLQNDLNEVLERSNEVMASDKLASFLRKYFGGSFCEGKGLTYEYIDNLAEVIVARRIASVHRQESYEGLLRETERLDPAELSLHKWRNLEYLAMCNGLLMAGLLFRDKMVKRAYLTSSTRSFENLEECFKASMDIGDFKTAERVLAQFRKFFPRSESYLQKHRLYYHLFKGERGKTLEIARSFYGENDLLFADYIRGKRVALVGPAPSDENVAEEIDLFDVVVRLNCYSLDKLPNKDEFGSKFNVSCHNGENGQLVSDLYSNYFLPDIDFVVFKYDSSALAKKMTASHTARIMHMAEGFLFGLMLSGTANMIQNIIFDLLLFQPQEIKLFKANFYLSEKTHYAGYQLNHNEQRAYFRKWEDFANHNILTQINFTRKLWHAEQIKVDKTCEAVLRLSNDEYVSKMEDIHIVPPTV